MVCVIERNFQNKTKQINLGVLIFTFAMEIGFISRN
ncbi:unnamed protein product [Brassica oleracea]